MTPPEPSSARLAQYVVKGVMPTMCANATIELAEAYRSTCLVFRLGRFDGSAQTPQGTRGLETTLIPGTTVWITDSGGREEKAQIVGVSGDIVTAAAGDEVRRLRMTDVMRVRVRQSDSVINGALIGAGVGVASGLFLCGLTEPWENCRDDVGPMFRIGALGAGIGIGIDALIRGRRTIYEAAERINTAARRANHRSSQERPAGLARVSNPLGVGSWSCLKETQEHERTGGVLRHSALRPHSRRAKRETGAGPCSVQAGARARIAPAVTAWGPSPVKSVEPRPSLAVAVGRSIPGPSSSPVLPVPPANTDPTPFPPRRPVGVPGNLVCLSRIR